MRIRATWLVSVAASRGIVRECGSPVRSSRCSDGAEHAGDVAVSPGVGEREAGDCALGATSSSTSAAPIRSPASPGRELVDLGRELVEVVADQLDQQPARLGVALSSAELELLADPAREAAVRHLEQQRARLSRRPPSRSARPSSARRRRARASCRAAAPRGIRRPPSRRALSMPRRRRRARAGLPEPNRPRALQAATASSPEVSAASSSSTASASKRARSRADRAVDLRAVGSRDQIRRLQLVRHRCQA